MTDPATKVVADSTAMMNLPAVRAAMAVNDAAGPGKAGTLSQSVAALIGYGVHLGAAPDDPALRSVVAKSIQSIAPGSNPVLIAHMAVTAVANVLTEYVEAVVALACRLEASHPLTEAEVAAAVRLVPKKPEPPPLDPDDPMDNFFSSCLSVLKAQVSGDPDGLDLAKADMIDASQRAGIPAATRREDGTFEVMPPLPQETSADGGPSSAHT